MARATQRNRVVTGMLAAAYVMAIAPGAWAASGFIWPATGSISSLWGDCRDGCSRYHAGVDIANSTGTPIYASCQGTVIYVGTYSGYGNTIDIRHAGNWVTRYAHLSGFNVSNGQTVARGQHIGSMGNTGVSTGPHLHFEIRQGQTFGYANSYNIPASRGQWVTANTEIPATYSGAACGPASNKVGDFVSESIPAAMRKGHSYNCSVTMKNSGSDIWACWPLGTMLTVGQFEGPAVCKLIPYPFYEIYTNPCVVEVTQECTFPFTVTVPNDAPLGNYEIQWQMKDNDTWFNTQGNNAIFRKTVYVHDNESQHVSNTIPSTMVAGRSYDCTIRMKNVGGQLWAAWPLGSMLTVGQFEGPEVCKLIPYPFHEVFIPQDGGSLPDQHITKPGATCTFPFTVTVPADTTPGTYKLKWEMKDNSVWFGQIYQKNVTVTAGNYGDSEGDTIPTTMQRGQTYNCTVSMKNSGTTTWNAWPTGSMLTVGQFEGPAVSKLIPYPFYEIFIPQDGGSLPDEHVTKPGDTCVFPFAINVPADAPLGDYEISWQLKDNSEWFNSDTHDAVFRKTVTVVNVPAPAPAVASAVSRKTHGGAGTFDVNVMAAGAVESRSGGPTTLVVTFNGAIEGVSGLPTDVSVSSGSVGGVVVGGSTLTISLSGAANAATLTVGFPGIRGAGGGAAATGSVCMTVLAGDVTGDRTVNVLDLVSVRNALNSTPAAGSFRNDVTADGGVNVLDLVAVRNVLNTSAPACP